MRDQRDAAAELSLRFHPARLRKEPDLRLHGVVHEPVRLQLTRLELAYLQLSDLLVQRARAGVYFAPGLSKDPGFDGSADQELHELRRAGRDAPRGDFRDRLPVLSGCERGFRTPAGTFPLQLRLQ